MDDIQKLIGLNNILKTKLKIELSVSEIRKNNAHRTDLIDSMNESIIDLEESALKWRFLQKECEMLQSLNNSLIKVNLVQINEIESLKKEIESNKVNLDYIDNLERENIELTKKIDLLINSL